MTTKPNEAQPSSHRVKGRGVLDPLWELELERGRDADDEVDSQGSIEPELAMLHLLRHAREPESVSEAELDSMWSDISQVVAPTKSSWLTRVGAAFSGQWARWLVPVAGLAVVVVIFQGTAGTESSDDPMVAMNSADSTDKTESASTRNEPSASAPAGPTAQDAAREGSLRAAKNEPGALGAENERQTGEPSTADLLEQQFSMLEARGRAKVDSSVRSQRTSLRSALIGQARGGSK